MAVFARELDIALLDDETVLHEGKPLRTKLQSYLVVVSSLVTALTVIGLPLLPLIWWAMHAFSQKHGYWLTSSRVVVTNGIIGYRTRSIPLERVSDVAIGCNWLQRLMGIRSVIVRDMTGEAQSGAAMMAVQDASAMQHKILMRVQEVNRSVSGGEGPALQGRPYREIEADRTQGEMLELLRRIESNTRSSDP